MKLEGNTSNIKIIFTCVLEPDLNYILWLDKLDILPM